MKPITVTDFPEFSRALDYLPVVCRAADRNPESYVLYFEAASTIRVILNYADARLPESDAAEVQAVVGTITRFSGLAERHSRVFWGDPDAAAIRSERAKTYLRKLLDPASAAR